jgi:hypothetical protein
MTLAVPGRNSISGRANSPGIAKSNISGVMGIPVSAGKATKNAGIGNRRGRSVAVSSLTRMTHSPARGTDGNWMSPRSEEKMESHLIAESDIRRKRTRQSFEISIPIRTFHLTGNQTTGKTIRQSFQGTMGCRFFAARNVIGKLWHFRSPLGYDPREGRPADKQNSSMISTDGWIRSESGLQHWLKAAAPLSEAETRSARGLERLVATSRPERPSGELGAGRFGRIF